MSVTTEKMAAIAGGDKELLAVLMTMQTEVSLVKHSQDVILSSLQSLPNMQKSLTVLTTKLEEFDAVKPQLHSDTRTLVKHATLLNLLGATLTVVMPMLGAWVFWLHSQLAELDREVRIQQAQLIQNKQDSQ